MTVKFLMGTQEKYESLIDKEATTFYYTGTNLYLGTILLSNGSEIADILSQLADAEGNIENIENVIGNLENLSTTNKNNLVSAINEVLAAIGSGGTDAVVSVVSSDDDDYAKVYNIYQGGTLVGTINIPKDLVVESGDVEVNPEGYEEGTYIVLTLANTDNQKIYINVGSLVDIYTVQDNAPQIQLAINNNIISASLVANSITNKEIADGSITTDKIADGNVTTDKLSTTVQEAISKASTAVQSVISGTVNGTILVDGETVEITGLGTAAYTQIADYDAAGEAATAESNAKAYADSLLEWGEF